MCQITLLSTFCTSPSCAQTNTETPHSYRQTRKKQLCVPRHLLGPIAKHVDQRVIWKVINRGHCNECQPNAYPGTRFKYKNVEERPTVPECCIWYAEWLGLEGEVVRELSCNVVEQSYLEGFEDGVVVGAVGYMVAGLMGQKIETGAVVEALKLRREDIEKAYALLWEARERIVTGEMRALGAEVELLPVPGGEERSEEGEKAGHREDFDEEEAAREVGVEIVEEDVEEDVQWYEGLH